MDKRSLIIAAAAASLFISGVSIASSHDSNTANKTTANQTKNHCKGAHSCKGKNHCKGAHSCKGKNHCKGVNSCKGKNHCKGADSCKGKNHCNGKS